MADPVRPNDPGDTPPGELQEGFDDFQAPNFPPNNYADDLLADVQATDTWYPQNTFDVQYELVTGNAVMRPMGPDGLPGERVKLQSEGWTCTIQWSQERANDWPDCPHPDIGDPNYVLIYAKITPAKPLEGIGRQRAFRVSGLYIYHLLKPLTDIGPFPTAASPESKADINENTMPALSFKRGMLAGVGLYRTQ
jgi:hypothetical protein